VDLALQYEDGYNENTFTFVNNINTHEGGTHLTGFKSALTRTINDIAKRRDFLKKENFSLSGEDIREGLTCVLHVKVREPQFEGQTKTKLGNSEVEGIVKAVVNEHLGAYLEEHPPVGAGHHREGRERGPGPRGGPQGARPGAEEVGPRGDGAPGQARRLLHRRPGL
jgi:DNA gyrase subunit B